jgi:hypothetical protein
LRSVLILALGAAAALANNLDSATAARFAALALDCIHREYPNKIAHAMNSDADAKPPRELTPAFYGCYDWHSSVHGHWLLVRVSRRLPSSDVAVKAKTALAASLTRSNLEREAAYLNSPGRATFERPYGLAWLLQLASDLRQWDDAQAREWSANRQPLEHAAVERVSTWIEKLPHPVRSGEHSNTAFSLGLMLDYARVSGNRSFEQVLERRARAFYLGDRGCPLNYEPSGEDFLSPCVAEADVVRRILPPAEFARWLAAFLPGIPKDGSTAWLRPGVVSDPSDGKLAHLDGLNLSRAWMLEAIASALPPNDPRTSTLRATSAEHARDGLRAVTGEHYEGGHWLASFAVYLLAR